MMTTTLTFPSEPPTDARDDHLLAPTKWTARAVIPVLVAAFVILYGFPGETMRLWSWMVCPEMNALIMGGGYLAGAYYFTRVAGAKEWHRVSAGFVAITVFSTLLMITTILHWERFNYDHVSFWAWLGLYASTPVLLPVLWFKNRRTDPERPSSSDARIPLGLRVAVGVGGALQLAFALVIFVWPEVIEDFWPWEMEPPTTRALSAFIAFPAVTWLWFLVDNRWSSFRITQQTATIGLVLIGLAALRARDEFSAEGWETPLYAGSLVFALLLNVALYLAMERRAGSRAA
ncbi:MAG TPA: hypothetical protein VHG90_00735 [Acidimicrobiales bacterium]|nr:hypothetical protein [Acidimicrobiales bacterium]